MPESLSEQCLGCSSLSPFPTRSVSGISVVWAILEILREFHPQEAIKLERYLHNFQSQHSIFESHREYKKSVWVAKELRKIPPAWDNSWGDLLPDASLCYSCSDIIGRLGGKEPLRLWHVEWIAKCFPQPSFLRDIYEIADTTTVAPQVLEMLLSTIDSLGSSIEIRPDSMLVASRYRVYRICFPSLYVQRFTQDAELLPFCVHPPRSIPLNWAIELQNLILALYNDHHPEVSRVLPATI